MYHIKYTCENGVKVEEFFKTLKGFLKHLTYVSRSLSVIDERSIVISGYYNLEM